MRRTTLALLCAASVFCSSGARGSDFFKTLKKEVLGEPAPKEEKKQVPAETQKTPEKKPRKMDLVFSGLGDLLAGASDVSYDTERVIGESLALEGFARYGRPVEDQDLQRYVNLVGNAVVRNSLRPDIPYRFVVVQSDLYNAFACPGGIVFVSSELVKALADEAELAGVLAHEVGHVAHKHALKSIQRAQFLSGVGKLTAASMKGDQGKQFQNMIGDLQTVLFDKGLDQGMEFEADQAAAETAYRTGYEPAGLIRVLEMLRRKEAGAQKTGSWFSTHPPLPQRLERLRAQVSSYADSQTLATVADRFTPYRARLR